MGQNSGWFNLADIENVLFHCFCSFILALRYNLKLLSILHVSDAFIWLFN
jgi:hypothetical protein